YFALSYCWGDLADTEEIVLEHFFCRREEDDDDHQRTFSITKNLAAALRRFKAANQFVLIWVDALCINQGNRKERGQQVQLMQEIYSNAYSAIVWLGEGDVRSDAAM
ncbi:heterokaryon incompatibility, partial [Cladorrhinum sp. PSN259]